MARSTRRRSARNSVIDMTFRSPPSGIGAHAFLGNPAGAAEPVRPADFVEAGYPAELDYRFAPYEARQFLGNKGTRTMDRTTALAVGSLPAPLP